MEHNGHGVEALSIGSSIDNLTALKNNNSRQATLDEYETKLNYLIITITYSQHLNHNYRVYKGNTREEDNLRREDRSYCPKVSSLQRFDCKQNFDKIVDKCNQKWRYKEKSKD